MKRLLLSAALFGLSATAFAGAAYAVPCTPGYVYVCDWSEYVTANVPTVITWNFKPQHGFTLAVPAAQNGLNQCWAEDDYAAMGNAGPNHGFPFGHDPVTGANVAYTTPPGYIPIGGVSVYCTGQASVWVEARSF
ncbi:MAG: hypothetical protein IVW56_09450 [Candidatus Binataceae bacterium]|nr:hypothetical protein [Candidatus Binataceae bacterium]